MDAMYLEILRWVYAVTLQHATVWTLVSIASAVVAVGAMMATWRVLVR